MQSEVGRAAVVALLCPRIQLGLAHCSDRGPML